MGLGENAEENQPFIGCLLVLPIPLNRNLCNFHYSKRIIHTCLLNSAFYSLINITPTQYRTIHSQAHYTESHNTIQFLKELRT